MAQVVIPPPRFEDILADMEVYFAAQSLRATDFNPGSVIRVILETVAQTQEKRDISVWSSLNRAIDQAVFDAWGFSRREATAATGQVSLYVPPGNTTSFTVQQGDIFTVPGSPVHIYEAVSRDLNEDGTDGWDHTNSTSTVWKSNINQNHATINIQCVNTGTAGNIGARLITQALRVVPGVSQILNLQAINNGLDVSTDAERRADFAAYVQSLPRGTVQALTYGASLASLKDNFGLVTSQVKKVKVVEGTDPATVLNVVNVGSVSLGPGKVAVFVNPATGSASQSLVNQAQQILDGYVDGQGVIQPGWRAAGIITTAYAATLFPYANIGVNVYVAKGFSLDQVIALCKLAISKAFAALNIGDTLLRRDLQYFLKLVPGVIDAEVTNLADFTAPYVNYLVTLGNIVGTAYLDGTNESF